MPVLSHPNQSARSQNVEETVQHAQAAGMALIITFPRGILVVADGEHLQHEFASTYSLAGTAMVDLSAARKVEAVDPASVEPKSYYMVMC